MLRSNVNSEESSSVEIQGTKFKTKNTFSNSK